MQLEQALVQLAREKASAVFRLRISFESDHRHFLKTTFVDIKALEGETSQ